MNDAERTNAAELRREEEPLEGAGSMGLRELKKQQTRDAMHRAALELVAEEGYAQVTAEMIARRAGVSTRTFFNHWSTKEAAILGIFAGESEKLVSRLRERLLSTSVRTALREVIRETLSDARHDPELRELKKQVMAQEPKLHSISAGNLQTVQSEMTEAITEVLDGEDAHDRAVIAVQVCFALTRSAFAISMARGVDLPHAFDEVTELYDARDGAF